jgi:hypothetical protein
MSEQHTQAGFLAFLVLRAFPFYYNRTVTYVLQNAHPAIAGSEFTVAGPLRIFTGNSLTPVIY